MTTDRETVLEVKTTGTFTVHLPEDAGTDLHAVLRECFDDCDAVRHVDALEIDQAYQIERY